MGARGGGKVRIINSQEKGILEEERECEGGD
jgi:hypothetical protein